MVGPIPFKIAKEWLDCLIRDTFLGTRDWFFYTYYEKGGIRPDALATKCGNAYHLCLVREEIFSRMHRLNFEMKVISLQPPPPTILYAIERDESAPLYEELSVLWELATITSKNQHRDEPERREALSMESVHRDIVRNKESMP